MKACEVSRNQKELAPPAWPDVNNNACAGSNEAVTPTAATETLHSWQTKSLTVLWISI